jgi:N-acetylglutamate synthase-like GNAT family acetyltransferase
LDLRRPRIASSSLRSSRIPNPRDRLWLAKTLDRVVGAIGILHETPHVARLSCFRVQPEWRQTAVLARLMDQAHHYCWNQGYLKLVVPSHVAPFVVQQMFDHRGFQLVRRKRSGQTERLEYIVDLYYVPRRAS